MKIKDDSYVTAFGEHLRALRKSKKLSQEQLANDADIPISQVGRIERGKVNTTLSTMKALSKALNVHITELFGFDIPKNN